jgi:hypothetical protein
VLVQRLDRDLTDGRAHLLLADVDDAHAALAEHTRHPVAPADHLADHRVVARCVGSGQQRAAAGAKACPLYVLSTARFTFHGFGSEICMKSGSIAT